MNAPLLEVDRLVKTYHQGRLPRRESFRLEADFSIAEPRIVGIMGPNGSGKTTLFELIAGSNRPTSGSVRCGGTNIHHVRYRERDRLAIHYHQSYQVRRFERTLPSLLLSHSPCDYPLVHLFDEPQFNPQDGYIGFMLEFFEKLRRDDRLVFVCLHPNEAFHLEILREICEQFIFVQRSQPLLHARTYAQLIAETPVRQYLGELIQNPGPDDAHEESAAP